MNFRGPKPLIPPALQPLVLAKVGEQVNYADICAWLAAEHGIHVEDSSIARLVRRDAKRNGEATKAELRRKLRKIVGTRFDHLAQLMRRAKRLERAATGGFALDDAGRLVRDDGGVLLGDDGLPAQLGSKSIAVALRAIREQANLLDLAYHYAGADEPDQPGQLTPKAEARKVLLDKVQAMVARARGEEPAGGNAADEVH